MKIALAIVVSYLIYEAYKKIRSNKFNFKRAFLFALIGAVIGTSLGVAGFGGAIAGWSVFGAIGFYIGGQENNNK